VHGGTETLLLLFEIEIWPSLSWLVICTDRAEWLDFNGLGMKFIGDNELIPLPPHPPCGVAFQRGSWILPV